MALKGVIKPEVNATVECMILDSTNRENGGCHSGIANLLFVLFSSGQLVYYNLSLFMIVKQITLESSGFENGNSKITQFIGRSYLVLWKGGLYLLDTIQDSCVLLNSFSKISGMTDLESISDICVGSECTCICYQYYPR